MTKHERHTASRTVPILLISICAAYLLVPLKPSGTDSDFNINALAKVPVSYKGRVKPFDTVARNSLMVISGRQKLENQTLDLNAAHWLLDVLSRPTTAEEYEVFRIDHPDVLAIFGWQKTDKKHFSARSIREHGTELIRQAQLAGQIPSQKRSLFQRKVVELASHLTLYDALANYRSLHLIPPISPQHDWMDAATAANHTETSGQPLPGMRAWGKALEAFNKQHADDFNQSVKNLADIYQENEPMATRQARHETLFNHYAPFAQCRVLYVFITILIFLSWIAFTQPLQAAAMSILLLTFLLHTGGIATRIYLSGRPPVTNLYSSAIFIGWGCILMCLVLEYLYRNGIPTLLAATSGFLTLLVAWALTGDGDTMAVLVAVLDTNFWLATHVVVIVLGYSATYLAGLIGLVFILRGVLTSSLSAGESKKMGQMLYGILCFALLFSFVGTVLGGIWADQSWGRFWGWDPKENGAVLIVLWNALVLHARWGGLVKQRGMAILAVFGNIVTSWSWKGTNMLGVGLHAYGFIESAIFWLAFFMASQLLIMAIGCLPLSCWRSFRVTTRSQTRQQANDGSPK